MAMKRRLRIKRVMRLGVLSALLCMAFYLFSEMNSKKNNGMVTVTLISTRGCENAEEKKLRIQLTADAQRFDQLDQGNYNLRSIVTTFSTKESWSLDHENKKAILLQDPSQIGLENKLSPIPDWKLSSQSSKACLDDRACTEWTFENDGNLLVLVTLPIEDSESVWLKSQQRDMKENSELGKLLRQHAPDQVLAGLERSDTCEKSFVSEVKISKAEPDLFMVPGNYQKNFYTDLQKLAPEIREAILKRQGVQILEARPEKGGGG